MKKIILICIVMLIYCKSKSQNIQEPQILPVEYSAYNGYNIPYENVYFKDINNKFDEYIGIWTGTKNNKNYTFIVSKYTTNLNYNNTKYDELTIRYKVIDSNTLEIIEDTTQEPINKAPCKGIRFIKNTDNELFYMLHYGGENYFCGQNGDVYITLNSDTEMYFLLYPNHEIYQECQTGQAEQILPTDSIILTKQ